jgi:hypothetical protein
MEKMLRIYFLQQWFNLSDPQAEDAIYASESMRRFARVELGDEVVPNESTILRFRQLLERSATTRASRKNNTVRFAVAAEIQLLTCGYSAQCTVRGCCTRAAMLARYTDGQRRPLTQRELCDRHADWLKANRPNVHDQERSRC